MEIKKLIEVALPLEKINAESSREKSIRQGHPSTLHLWWARRPLAAARAVIWASLVDDPSSHPELFPTEEEQNNERKRLFLILEKLVEWENTTNEEIINVAKEEIRKYNNGEFPAFLDPFSGGGAIPLEAQRLGLDTHAHDLNPVAVMINKAMTEIPVKFLEKPPVNPASCNKMKETWTGARGLAADVSYYSELVKRRAQDQIGEFYPQVEVPKEKGGGKATVVAWIWTRTVKCANPACGCVTPLVKSFELTKKKGRICHVEPHIENGKIRYTVEEGKSLLKGTVGRKGATCMFCGSPIGLDYIREAGMRDEIGYDLMATIAEGKRDKLYISPDELQKNVSVKRPQDYPDSEIAYYPGCTNCRIYGMEYFGDLYTNRQLTSLVEFSNQVINIWDQIYADAKMAGFDSSYAEEYASAVQVYLAFGVDRLATRLTKVCLWNTTAETIEQPFGRQAIPMVWTFPEGNVFSNSTGGWTSSVDWIPKVLENIMPGVEPAEVSQQDAMTYEHHTPIMISTDPPYYSNVPYADLADFFYLWLRKILRNKYPDIFSTISTPKSNELVAEKYRYEGDEEKAKKFFENGMFKTFNNIAQYVHNDIPLTVYYAFKQTETEENNGETTVASSGWETILSALINAGFVITGTWPMRTERTSGLKNSLNALGTSIVLVCRKRNNEGVSITRRNFVAELRRELKPAIKQLQQSNLAPVDMAQSAIGPGMKVFSKYEKVLESDGTEMSVREALHIINQELDLYLNEQVGDLDASSRFCVDLYCQYAFNDIRFAEAELLANAKGTSIPLMSQHGVLYAKAGNVHLIERSELTAKIDHNEENIWLLTQQLTYAMEKGGIEECSNIVYNIFGSNAERAKDLAYRLYNIAEQKNWANEAYAYNALVVAWPDIQSRAAEMKQIVPEQMSIFDMIGDNQ